MHNAAGAAAILAIFRCRGKEATAFRSSEKCPAMDRTRNNFDNTPGTPSCREASRRKVGGGQLENCDAEKRGWRFTVPSKQKSIYGNSPNNGAPAGKVEK